MKKASHFSALALVALSLSACTSTQPAKPDAYQATPSQLMDAIARMAPTLPVKALNQPFRVTSRTANELVISTPLKPSGVALGLLTGAGVSSKAANITYRFQQQNGLTLVTSTVNAEGGEMYSRRAEIDAMLAKTFKRVQLP